MIAELSNLIKNFEINFKDYKSSEYNEYSVRSEYIDKFIECLGWDITNKSNKREKQKEVKREASIDTGRPDYSITLNGEVKFHIEAKKPSVDIRYSEESALQARNYGWKDKKYISVLTNFEYLRIYDTSVPPNDGDNPGVALFREYYYKDYVDKFEEIKGILSRDLVYSGKFEDSLIEQGIGKQGLSSSVDEEFVKNLNKWRLKLGDYLFNNKRYSIDIINDSIQEFINEIIFLRICEDRNLPLYYTLKEIIETEEDLLKELTTMLIRAEKKYGSNIFSNKNIIMDLNNEIIKEIIYDLYYPINRYKYNFIDPHILGEVYELFLSEKLVVDEVKNEITLRKKDLSENKDIVTTPLNIVRKMVSDTLEKLCKGKSFEEILELNIADIACGSGIFLGEVYEYLINHCIDFYIKNDLSKLEEIYENKYKLKFEDKKLILESCIYGIDIDIHAMEATKFNLLIRLLEDENDATLDEKSSILPNLDEHIVCGNSLVEIEDIKRKRLTEEEKNKINAFDWKVFDKVEKFDLIIGNPPYLKTGDIKNTSEKELGIYKKKYISAHKQFDKYYLFIEKALSKIKDDGYLCYIVPNKFIKTGSSIKLRELIKDKIIKFIDFGSAQLFFDRGKTVYSSIILLTNKKQSKFKYRKVNNYIDWVLDNISFVELNPEILASEICALIEDEDLQIRINDMYENSYKLSSIVEISNGIQTSAETSKVYWFCEDEIKNITDEYFEVEKNDKKYKIEKSIVKRYFKPVKPHEKGKKSYDACVTDKYIIFPYIEGNLIDINTMKQDFINTWKYLNDNKEYLWPKKLGGKRDVQNATEDNWYQYGRSQNFKYYDNIEKLIVRVMNNKLKDNPMYMYDFNNFVVSSGDTAGYCMIMDKENSDYRIEYIQAYLTFHPTLKELLIAVGSDFDNNFFSCGKSILTHIPIKRLDFEDYKQKEIHDKIVELSRDVYAINEKLLNPYIGKQQKNMLENEKQSIIECIKELVFKIYSMK